MLTGFQKLSWSRGTSTFYFDEQDGYMVTGWREIKYNEQNNRFYFDPTNGDMYENRCETIGGTNYCFDENGVMQE